MENNKMKTLPIAVADIFVDEILEATDEEIIEMTQEQFGDVDTHTNHMQKVIKQAVEKSKNSPRDALHDRIE